MQDQTRGIAENMDKIFAVLEREMKSRSSHPWKEPGNKFYHGVRTAKIALRLRDGIFPGTQDPELAPEILTVAAWFHDIANGQNNHEALGAARMPELIGEYCTEEELDRICRIISLHDHRTWDTEKTLPDAVKLVQDADLLDHLGTYEVWMAFSEFSYRHRSPLEYGNWFLEEDYRETAEGWVKTTNYPLSLVYLREKMAFEKAFGERLRRELDGELIEPSDAEKSVTVQPRG